MARRIASSTAWTRQLALPGYADPPKSNGERIDPTSGEKLGVVYTKPWVAEFLLDLVGYVAERDLTQVVAVEPAAGEGAFALPMVQRLFASCQQQQIPIATCQNVLLFVEYDPMSAMALRAQIAATLLDMGVANVDASVLAQGWVRCGDYLDEAYLLPAADIVVGNPPYIRAEQIADNTKKYRDNYRTMQGRADLYIAFFEAALRQLKPNGACGYICADRWMLNQYGAALRDFVAAGYAVEAIVNMHHAEPFTTKVDAYPAITLMRRSPQGAVVVASATQEAAAESNVLAAALHAVRTSNDAVELPGGVRASRMETWTRGTDPWPVSSPERLALLKRLEAEFPLLEDSASGTKVSIGVATGLDDVFITADARCVESARLLPLALSNDLATGTLHWSRHYLVNPWNAEGLVDLDRYPQLADYLQRHRDRLRERYVARRDPQRWYRTIDRVDHTLLSKHKLYFHDIKDRINPVLDRGETYPHHNLYVIYSDSWDLEVLGGLLMSAIGQFFVESYGVRMRGGYLRFQAQYLRRIRVPRPQDLTEDQALALRAAFRKRDVAAATAVALEIYRISALPTEEAYGA